MFLIDLCSPFVKHPHISPVLSRSCSPKGRSITWGSYSLLVVLFRFLFVKWLTPEMCTFSMFHFGHILFSVGWTAEKGKVLQKVIPGQNDNSDEESVGTRSPPLLPEFFGILTAPKQTTLTPSNIPYLSPSRLTAPQQMLFHSSIYCSWLLGFWTPCTAIL